MPKTTRQISPRRAAPPPPRGCRPQRKGAGKGKDRMHLWTAPSSTGMPREARVSRHGLRRDSALPLWCAETEPVSQASSGSEFHHTNREISPFETSRGARRVRCRCRQCWAGMGLRRGQVRAGPGPRPFVRFVFPFHGSRLDFALLRVRFGCFFLQCVSIALCSSAPVQHGSVLTECSTAPVDSTSTAPVQHQSQCSTSTVPS